MSEGNPGARRESFSPQSDTDPANGLHSRLVDAVPFFYGWVVLGAGTLVMAMTIPGQTVGISVFLDSIIEELGINRSTISIIYAGATAIGAMSLTFVGRFLDRVGPRVGVAVIGSGFVLACVLFGTVQTVVMLAIGFVLLRGLGQGSLSLAATYSMNLWFVRRRGLAIGIGSVGFAAAIAVIPATFERLHQTYGWRTSYFILAGVVAVVVLPLSLLFRRQPERYGLQPDGLAPLPDTEPSIEPSLARRSTVFWLFSLGAFTTSGLGTGVVFHHFSILESSGLTRSEAASVFLPYGIAGAAFGLIGGALVDRFPHRYSLAAGQLLMAAVLLSAVHLTTAAHLWAYGAALGAMQGTMLAVAATVYAHEFGRRFLGEIKGTAATIGIGGSAVGPLLYGVAYDLTGSYASTLAWSALVPLGIAAVALFRPPRSLRTEKPTVAQK